MNTSAHRQVVVGFDGSDGAQAALAHGAWEADRRGCPLRLVSGYNVAPPYGILGYTPLARGRFADPLHPPTVAEMDALGREYLSDPAHPPPEPCW